MDSILQDLRIAVRSLARRRGFTVVAVTTLALGLGATTALFSVVHGILLRPLPYPDPDRVVALWQTSREEPGPSVGGTTSHLNYLDWKRQATSFDAMAVYSRANFNVTGLGEAEVMPGAIVTPDFFRVFASTPLMGREFGPDDDRPAAPAVIVVSHAFWMGRLGGRADVLGSLLEISGRNWQIVGVAPPGFGFPNDARIWQPVRNDDQTCGRGCIYLDGVGRLLPGVTLEAAREEMDAVARRLEAEYPNENANVMVGMMRLQDQIVGDVRAALLLLLGAVIVVLLIACANVANLMLVRGAARQDEIAVRAALGASRARLVRLLLTESLVLAAAGAAVGLLLGWWGVDILKQMAPLNIPRLDDVGLDLATFGFTLALAAVTAVIFGLGPAVQIVRMPLVAILGARADSGMRSPRWSRSGLLVAEVALSVLLLTGAGLMLRSLAALQTVDPGWRSGGIVLFTTSLPSIRYPETADVTRGFEELDARLSAVPGVQRVARIAGVPLGPSINVLSFRRSDRPEPEPGRVPVALYRSIDDTYFATAGIPLLAGRPFDTRDRADGPPTVIISREMAERFWPGEAPIGTTIQIGATTRTIVGIVAGVRSTNLAEPPQPEMYVPHAQSGARSATFLLQSSLPPGQVLSAARQVVREFDRRLSMFQPRAWSELEADALARPRFYLALLGVFAILALALASVGIYGVVAYAVSLRTREIGVRMALGARAAEVVRLVVMQGLRPASAGLVLGLAAAIVLGRFVSGLLYQVEPRDPLTLSGVVAVLAAVTLVACLMPAWRATRIPPASALRAE